MEYNIENMNDSLQQIEDYYIAQGLKGNELRIALENDTKYQQLLKQRKSVIRNKYGITEQEEKEYLLPNQEDYKILSMLKTLEDKDLSSHDREIVGLIKTQLRHDWRGPLLEKLKKLTQKYS